MSVHLVKWGRSKRMMGEERGGEGSGGRRGRQRGKREMEEELHTTCYQL